MTDTQAGHERANGGRQTDWRASAHTDPGLVVPGALGLLLGFAAYGILYLFRSHPFAAMFFQPSRLIAWIPPAEVFLSAWALGMLILKARMRRGQERALDSQVANALPERITAHSCDEIVNTIHRGYPDWRRSFLLKRIVRLLVHYRTNPDRAEVSRVLASQSEIDGTSVKASYSMLRVLNWAVPVLGFIGTVLGLQDAIGGFSGLDDITQLSDQLRPITVGLSGAFQTTLIALILSIVTMFPSSAEERKEWRLLNTIDDFCSEQVVARLWVERPASDELDGVLKRLSETLADVSDQMVKSAEAHRERADQLQNAAKEWLDTVNTRTTSIVSASTAADTLASTAIAVSESVAGVPEAVGRAVSERLGPALGEVSAIRQDLLDLVVAVQGASRDVGAAAADVRGAEGSMHERSQAMVATAGESQQLLAATSHLTQSLIDSLQSSLAKASSDFAATVTQAQLPLRECVDSLRAMSGSLQRVGTHVNAQLELESVRQAVDRVIHVLGTNPDGGQPRP